MVAPQVHWTCRATLRLDGSGSWTATEPSTIGSVPAFPGFLDPLVLRNFAVRRPVVEFLIAFVFMMVVAHGEPPGRAIRYLHRGTAGPRWQQLFGPWKQPDREGGPRAPVGCESAGNFVIPMHRSFRCSSSRGLRYEGRTFPCLVGGRPAQVGGSAIHRHIAVRNLCQLGVARHVSPDMCSGTSLVRNPRLPNEKMVAMRCVIWGHVFRLRSWEFAVGFFRGGTWRRRILTAVDSALAGFPGPRVGEIVQEHALLRIRDSKFNVVHFHVLVADRELFDAPQRTQNADEEFRI